MTTLGLRFAVMLTLCCLAVTPQVNRQGGSRRRGTIASSAQNQDVSAQVIGTTAVQAILFYSAPDSNPCTIEVSVNSSFSPLVHDVDPTLFPSSNTDGGGASPRIFVVGRRKADVAVDGNRYSRALQTQTTYYYQVTCDGQPANGSFQTANIPVGKTFAEPLPIDKLTGQYDWPTLSADDRTQQIIDPLTGVLLRHITLPAEFPNDDVGWPYGGQEDLCNTKLSNGGYHCVVPTTTGDGNLYWINPSTAEVRYLGVTYFWDPNLYCTCVFLSNWDSSDPNVVYAVGRDKQTGKPVLDKGTLTGNDQAVSPGTAVQSTWQTLTPANTNNAIPDLISAFDPTYSPSQFPCFTADVNAVESHYVNLICWSQGQDSSGWVAVLDLGNGKPAGTDPNGVHLVAATAPFRNPTSRWCGLHNDNSLDHIIGNESNFPIIQIRSQDGPYNSTLESGVGASDTTFYVSGEPLGSSNNYLMDAASGDYFQIEAEVVEITSKVSSTQWTVQRGVNGHAQPHNAGVNLTAQCNDQYLTAGPTYGNGGQLYWQFTQDPHGTDTTNTYYAEDPLGVSHNAIQGQTKTDPAVMVTDPYRVRSGKLPQMLSGTSFPPFQPIPISPAFAGTVGDCNPNGCESHMYYNQMYANEGGRVWFGDIPTFVGGASNQPGAVLVPGTTQIYQYFGNPRTNNGEAVAPYQSYFGIAGTTPLLDISGPNSALLDGAPGAYTYCVVSNAGECISSSDPGDVYANVPNLVDLGCVIYANSPPSDVCILNQPTYGEGLVQIGTKPPPSGYPAKYSRILTYRLQGYRSWQFSNTKILPNASWALFLGGGFNNPVEAMMAKIPSYLPPDGIDRSKFINVPITVPTMSGATSVRVYYGYEEDNSRSAYFCAQYQAACMVTSTPGSGLNLPGVPQRIMFIRIDFLNNSGNVIGSQFAAAEVDHKSVTPFASGPPNP
jgi:hypothetical protein